MKVLVSDFDLTLYDDNYANNVLAIRKFVKEGNIFIIATGRSMYDLERDLVDIPCKWYICKDGASIYNDKKELIYRCDIDTKEAYNIYNYLVDSKNYKELYIDNGAAKTSNIDNVNSIIGVPNDFNVALKDLEYLKNNYNIDGYISRHWININNKKCNKASGIEYLKNKYNLENIYTVGDTVNDYLMIKNYKGYAMDAANNYIKEVSVSTISSLEELIKKISNLD